MKTNKGNIKELNIKNNSGTSYVQTFILDNVKVEITTEESIEAQDGDFVIVAGVDGLDEIFKAYSLKNLN